MQSMLCMLEYSSRYVYNLPFFALLSDFKIVMNGYLCDTYIHFNIIAGLDNMVFNSLLSAILT